MKSNYTLAVAGSKGGVGKTTTSINLAACFADAGYETVVVEFDLAMANLVDFVSLEMDPRRDDTLHDVLADGISVVETVYEVGKHLSVVPSGTEVGRYAELDVDELERVLDHLWWHFDVIVLDTPAGVGPELTKPIGLADETLLVSTPRVSSIRNARNTKAIVERVGTDIAGLVLTKSGTGASPGAKRIAEFLDLDLLGHVPEDDAIPHSQDRGRPVVEYAPRSGAATAYRKIATQLVENIDVQVEGGGSRETGADDAEADRAVSSSETGNETDRAPLRASADPDPAPGTDGTHTGAGYAEDPLYRGGSAAGVDDGAKAPPRDGTQRDLEDETSGDSGSPAGSFRHGAATNAAEEPGGSDEESADTEAETARTDERRVTDEEAASTGDESAGTDEAVVETGDPPTDSDKTRKPPTGGDKTGNGTNDEDESLVSQLRSAIGL